MPTEVVLELAGHGAGDPVYSDLASCLCLPRFRIEHATARIETVQTGPVRAGDPATLPIVPAAKAATAEYLTGKKNGKRVGYSARECTVGI